MESSWGRMMIAALTAGGERAELRPGLLLLLLPRCRLHPPDAASRPALQGRPLWSPSRLWYSDCANVQQCPVLVVDSPHPLASSLPFVTLHENVEIYLYLHIEDLYLEIIMIALCNNKV